MPHRLLFGMSFLMVCMGLTLLPGCGPITFTLGSGPEAQAPAETVVKESSSRTRNKVAIIDVSGMIINSERSGFLSQSENPVAMLHERLNRAEKDDDVVAVILRINSPGGTVTASDLMYNLVMDFRKQSGKPVVVQMVDVAASGGYYLACSGDHIVAHPTTVTGSVGVIMQTFSVKPALDRIGVESHTYKSGPAKDAGSPFSEVTEHHEKILQGMIDEFYASFRKVVRDRRRGIPVDRFDELTDGRVVTGKSAMEVGMVDSLGGLFEAFAKARELAGIKHAHLVLYHAQARRVGSPYATRTEGGNVEISLARFDMAALPELSQAGFYYLWQPVE